VSKSLQGSKIIILSHSTVTVFVLMGGKKRTTCRPFW